MPIFDIQRILRETFICDVDYCPVVDSTNTRAAEWAKCGKARLPLLVLADRQTAGRGRGTNRWWTGEGSLAFSLLIDDTYLPPSSSQFPLISLAAGVAVIKAMQMFLPGHHVQLFWPNNVVVEDRKLGGILVEISGGQFAIIGIGVNLNNSMRDAPAELQPIAVSAFDLTANVVNPSEALIQVIRNLERELRSLRHSKIITDIPPYCLPQNHLISVHNESGITTGICRGIEAGGAIILEIAGDIRSIHAWAVRSEPTV
jgi:BirA family biotin operon repressor/biotin-[acetyl-CoA-carboxylase] ligase